MQRQNSKKKFQSADDAGEVFANSQKFVEHPHTWYNDKSGVVISKVKRAKFFIANSGVRGAIYGYS
jgi:hypothetical protein